MSLADNFTRKVIGSGRIELKMTSKKF